MIRCNNCMEIFVDEDDLRQIVEQSGLQDDGWYTVDRFLYE